LAERPGRGLWVFTGQALECCCKKYSLSKQW
jgi:hypothetical protein